MIPSELARAVVDALSRSGHGATLTLTMPGRWGKRDTKRLCPGGPAGRIVSETPSGLLVSFEAMDLTAWLTAKGFLRTAIVQRDGVPGGVVTFEVAP